MVRRLTTIALLLLATPAALARPHFSWKKVAEHVSLGASVELGMAALATRGCPARASVGIPAAALVAAFKEGADAVAGADTRQQAAWHAATQLVGASAAALAARGLCSTSH